jgi:hypothetical protein
MGFPPPRFASRATAAFENGFEQDTGRLLSMIAFYPAIATTAYKVENSLHLCSGFLFALLAITDEAFAFPFRNSPPAEPKRLRAVPNRVSQQKDSALEYG